MFVIQLIIATSVTRLLLLVAKPLRQPPFLAEYLVSIICCCIYSFPSILYLGSLMVVLVVVGEIFFMIWTNICMVNCIEYLYIQCALKFLHYLKGFRHLKKAVVFVSSHGI